MMKRRISLFFLAAAMLCALAAPALADVLWEPYGNSFYEQHRDQCGYVGRSYLANGQKGYVTLLGAPGGLAEVYNVPNGERVYVGFDWEDSSGAQWACCEYAVEQSGGGYDWKSGWAALSGLALIYDDTCFREDHEAELAEYDGSGDGLKTVCLYSYPGGTYSHTLKESKDYMAFADSFNDLYTDENGRRWSYIGYYMGRQNAWACLDDPLNEDLGTDGPLAALEVRGGGTLAPAQDAAQVIIPPAESIPAPRTGVFWAVPAGLIAVAAAGTAVLAGRLRKKRREGADPS